MRAVAATISGAYALLIMATMLPWDAAECARAGAGCVTSEADAQIFTFGFTAVALTIPTLLLLVILLAVLGLRSTRDPESGAVLAALGQTRGTAVRRAALQGLRDGAIAIGAAWVVAGAIHVGMLTGTGLNPFTSGGQLWWGRGLLGLTVVLALVGAHVLTAARRPRTPVDALTADMHADPAPRPSLKVRTMIAGGALALSGGVIVGIAVSMRDTPWTDVSVYAKNAAGIAMIIAWPSALALGLWAAIPWLRRRRTTVVGLAARAAGRESRVGSVLATYAGDRSRASARIVTVLAALGFLIASVPSQAQTSDLNKGLLSTVVIEGEVDQDSLEEEYRALDGVEDVITTGAAIDGGSAYPFVFAVTPDSVRDRDAPLAEALERHPQAVGAPLWYGEVATELLSSSRFDVDEVNPIPTCCGAFVNADQVELKSEALGFLIFAAPDADLEATREAIDNVASGMPAVSTLGGSTVVSGSTAPVWNVAINLALAALVLGLPLSMLAVGAVRRRHRDDATLRALGATKRTMRAATTIEMTVVSAFAIAGGAVVGAATRVVMTALQQARLSLGPVVIESPLMTGFDAIGWAAIATVSVASVAIVAVAAFVTAWVTGRGRVNATPRSRQRAPLP